MKGKIESVQMMRGVAALSVVVCHLGILGGSGGFGVDLFFCISGFIMMLVTEKSTDSFLFKRVIRICPLYYILTLGAFTIAFIAPQLLRSPDTEISALLRSFAFVSGSAEEAQPIVGVGWTLCYEMWFYLLFFIAFKISHKNRHYIATTFLLILVFAGIILKSENEYLKFYTQPIFLEFALGMFAYKIVNCRKKYNTKQHFLLLLAIIIYLSMFFWSIKTDRLFSSGIPTFVCFILFFKALENKNVAKPLVVLGNISYSLYLTHTFVITAFSRLIWAIEPKVTFLSVVASIIAASLTIGVAYCSWYLIEQKLTEWIKMKIEKSR